MANNKPGKRPHSPPDAFQQARDELFSHILRCGVLEASEEHKKDWFDDTMEYLSDRYETLTEAELAGVRQLGEQYCRPLIRKENPVAAAR
jgi:hypothetical protein